MAWKVEVIADDTDKWCSSALRFATREEAEAYASDLFSRWTAVREKRVTECDDPVNYTFIEGRLERCPVTAN